MKKNPIATNKSFSSIFAEMFDPWKQPEGMFYWNPYSVKWKRGRPTKEMYEQRDWAIGYREAFFVAYPHLSPDYHIKMLIQAMGGKEKITKIKRPRKNKKKNLIVVKRRERFTVAE